MITVASFSKPEEAHLLRMRLEAGGVPAFVLDENMVQMDWMFSNAIGGVRVVIEDGDAGAAREILSAPPADLPGDRPVCPACASTNTAPDELPRRIAFLSLLLTNFPFLFARHRWKCADCGRAWNERTGRGA